MFVPATQPAVRVTMREDDPNSDDDTRSLLTPHIENNQDRNEAFLLQSPVPRLTEPTEYDLEIEEELAYSAAHVTSILKPVSITMFLVVLIVKATREQIGGTVVQSPYLVYRQGHHQNCIGYPLVVADQRPRQNAGRLTRMSLEHEQLKRS